MARLPSLFHQHCWGMIASLLGVLSAAGQPGNQLLLPPVAKPPPAASPTARPPQSPPLLPASTSAGAAPTPVTTAAPPANRVTDSRNGVRVQKGAGTLPNEHGQIWREYDISPYTLSVRDVAQPEQAIVDWILRDTGTKVWFTEPLGILNASSTTLRVYHTPEMQDVVRGIVERFVTGPAEVHPLGVRLITVGSPNWRQRSLSLLKPVDVKSAGVEAWLLSRENALTLMEQLKARADFREHSAPVIDIANGQSQKLTRTQTRSYVRSVQLKREFPFYDSIPAKLDEGYSLEISPLLSLDGQSLEVAIDCSVDQLEKLVPLTMDVPAGSQTQRVQIQVPQLVSWKLSERFRWPTNEVLLLSCGVVATPAPGSTGMLSLLAPLGISGNRADALLLIERKPPSVATIAPVMPPSPPAAAPESQPTPSAGFTPGAAMGAPTGSANSISRGRY